MTTSETLAYKMNSVRCTETRESYEKGEKKILNP